LQGEPSVCTQIPPSPVENNGGTSGGTIAAIIVPTVVALLAIGGSVIFVLYRKGRKKVLKKPDFKDVAFGSDGNAPPSEPITPEKRKLLETMEEVCLLYIRSHG
jgi:hypothetical protein